MLSRGQSQSESTPKKLTKQNKSKSVYQQNSDWNKRDKHRRVTSDEYEILQVKDSCDEESPKTLAAKPKIQRDKVEKSIRQTHSSVTWRQHVDDRKL